MKINLSISKDGVNGEAFPQVNFTALDDKSVEKVEQEVGTYCKSALSSIVTQDILEMKVDVPPLPLKVLVGTYFELVKKSIYPDVADRLQHIITPALTTSVKVLIDDLIWLLLCIKGEISADDIGHYNTLRSIVFEHCQLENPNSI